MSKQAEDIRTFLEQLENLCTDAEQKYLALYPESLSFVGVSKSLRDIWAKLEILVNREKYTHAMAIEQPLW